MRATLIAPALVLTLAGYASFVNAQTTAGSGTTLVIPVTSQSASFVSEVTVFNPGPTLLTASVKFYEANNSSVPGSKSCNDLSVSANRSVQFQLATQCALGAGDGSRFGLIVITDKAVPPTHAFYGYSRVQNPQGIGFSVEGFPVQDFNNQVSHATGLKKQAATPTYQTNCFVASLDQAVSYELKLFNDATGAQIGGTLAGSLQPFQQFRYLDVFGSKGVNAPAGDRTNVRAQFTQTSGGSANLISFCTVQDNMSFGADFRIAKSFGSPSGNLFAQGGNAFGTTATLGTSDNQPLNIKVNNQRVMRYEPRAASPNIVGGNANNGAGASFSGQTIAGGGLAGNDCFDPETETDTRSCANHTSGDFATVGGGQANLASDIDATVAGGMNNTASQPAATVAGGRNNIAKGNGSFAAGSGAVAAGLGSFVIADGSMNPPFPVFADNGFGARYTGGFTFASSVNPTTGFYATGCQLFGGGGSWACTSDRNTKTALTPVDPQSILQGLVALPITQWRFSAEPEAVRHLGPMAQDFRATFGLGHDDKSISMLDGQGVALASIQGLHHLVQEQVARIAALERRLLELERIVEAFSTKP